MKNGVVRIRPHPTVFLFGLKTEFLQQILQILGIINPNFAKAAIGTTIKGGLNGF